MTSNSHESNESYHYSRKTFKTMCVIQLNKRNYAFLKMIKN